MGLLIKNARVVDKYLDGESDIYIKDGVIKLIEKNISNVDVDEVIDASGLVVMPAFVDLHAHFREPGNTEKEDLKTGSLAALRGGYTFVNLMANTKPPISSMEMVDYVLDKSKELDLIDIHQVITVTENFDGKTIDHLDSLDLNKVKVISEDGYEVMSNKVMLDAMKKARGHNLLIMSHAEEMEISKEDYRIAENIMTLRNLYLANETEVRIHMSHVSTKEALIQIKYYKEAKNNVSCEVSPHHIALIDSDYRVNPPIREIRDRLAIIDGIKTGIVDAIATDHAPHTEADKAKGAPGMVGLETAFAVCFTELVDKKFITLNKLVELMSRNPSEIMGINKGKLMEGYDGDVVLVDLEKSYRINSEKFHSKSKNTAFENREVKGKVVATVKAGKVKYRNEDYNI